MKKRLSAPLCMALCASVALCGEPAAAKAATSKGGAIQFSTFDTVDGVTRQVPATWTGVDANGQISCADIKSLRMFKVKDITFTADLEDVIKADPIEYDLRKTGISFENHPNEFMALFVAHHTQRCLDTYRRIFDGKLSFETKKHYHDLEIYVGNAAYLSSPKTFILPLNTVISPSLIYHEFGHRAFWILEGDLEIPIGNPNNYMHVGLLEYYTASIGNNPCVGEGFFPVSLYRHLEKPVTHPKDFVSVGDSLRLLEKALSSLDAKEPWNKAYIAAYVNSGQDLEKTHDGHRSGMMISHPLWKLRQALGAPIVDKLVAQAILNLPRTLVRRVKFLPRKWDLVPKTAEWYDLVYSLIEMDKAQNQGKNTDLIKKVFKETGYEVDLLKM